MSIFRLPIELVILVADGLEPEDILHLSQTAKALSYLVRYEALCKQVLLARAPYSPEAIRATEDGDYARGLRALAKRRNAIRMAEPFHVALLGVGTAFTYTDGVLCYTAEHGRLRLLDIRGSADREVVVDVRQVLLRSSLTVPRFDQFKVRPLHFSHGILTCIVTIKHLPKSSEVGTTTHYLLILEPRATRIICAERLAISRNIHVKNTDRYLFLYHMLPPATQHRWGRRQLDLEMGKWLRRPALTPIGVVDPAHVAFDIIGDYLYTTTSRALLQSCHVNRLPISGPLDACPEVAVSHDDWARAYSATLSDERWAMLRTERDEVTGKPVAVQVRRAFPELSHHTSRVCIRRDLRFWPARPGGEDVASDTSTGDASGHGTAPGASAATGLSGASFGTGGAPDSSTPGEGPDIVLEDGAELPAGTRIHRGDSSSTLPRYDVLRCFVRSYFSTSNSFVDLVNDTHRRNQQTQSLRLRVMSELPSGATQTVFWPPAPRRAARLHPAGTAGAADVQQAAPDDEEDDPRLEHLHRILNPPGYDGYLTWAVDEGSFVYAMDVSERSHQKAIVYVGFDPAVKLHGLAAYHKRRSAEGDQSGERGEGPGKGGRAGVAGRDGEWTWLEEPLYFQPRETNGFDFFG